MLIRIVASLPSDMPVWLDLSIRGALHLVGRDDLANPDGMEDVAELAFTALALSVGSAVVWSANALFQRRSMRRIQRHR